MDNELIVPGGIVVVDNALMKVGPISASWWLSNVRIDSKFLGEQQTNDLHDSCTNVESCRATRYKYCSSECAILNLLMRVVWIVQEL